MNGALVRWMRTIHIYLSMAGFVLMAFFAATGLLLNHREALMLDEVQSAELTGRIAPERLVEGKDAITAAVRQQFRIQGELDSFDAQDDVVEVVLKSPGKSARATIDRTSGRTTVEVMSEGLLGRLTALHTGKNSGKQWWWAIDAVAVVLLVSASTGLLICISQPTRRQVGLAAMLIAGGLCAGLFLASVPW